MYRRTRDIRVTTISTYVDIYFLSVPRLTGYNQGKSSSLYRPPGSCTHAHTVCGYTIKLNNQVFSSMIYFVLRYKNFESTRLLRYYLCTYTNKRRYTFCYECVVYIGYVDDYVIIVSLAKVHKIIHSLVKSFFPIQSQGIQRLFIFREECTTAHMLFSPILPCGEDKD